MTISDRLRPPRRNPQDSVRPTPRKGRGGTVSRPNRLVRAKHLLLVCAASAVAACGNDSASPPTPVASVEVTAAAPGVVIGHTLQLTATVRDAAGHELADRPVTWTSNAPTQGPVSPAGLVTGLALSDTVVITATTQGKSGSATLAVVIDLAGEWNFTEQLSGRHQQRALRSEEHTSELQSPVHLVCRLLLEKKKRMARRAGARTASATGGTLCRLVK